MPIPEDRWHDLVLLIQSDRQKLMLKRLLAKAENCGINPADLLPAGETRQLAELSGDELDAILRSMWEMS